MSKAPDVVAIEDAKALVRELNEVAAQAEAEGDPLTALRARVRAEQLQGELVSMYERTAPPAE